MQILFARIVQYLLSNNVFDNILNKLFCEKINWKKSQFTLQPHPIPRVPAQIPLKF